MPNKVDIIELSIKMMKNKDNNLIQVLVLLLKLGKIESILKEIVSKSEKSR